MSTILLTGASGFIGQALARTAADFRARARAARQI